MVALLVRVVQPVLEEMVVAQMVGMVCQKVGRIVTTIHETEEEVDS